ncbi:oxidoreductase [Rhodococcus sp. 14-2483-1-1]|nr:oxidoreductase [Rhodococcus sp. 14-2483-1-1]
MTRMATPPSLTLVDVSDDTSLLRKTFALFPSGIVMLSAVIDDVPVGLVASSFQVGISADPPLVLFAVQHTSTTWPRLRRAPRLGVSVLSGLHRSLIGQLSSKSGDRFDGIDSFTSETQAHFIGGAAAHLECSIHSEIRAGDHDVVLMEVHRMGSDPSTEPLVWHGSTLRSLTPPEPTH